MGPSSYDLTGDYLAGVDGKLCILDILDIPDIELGKPNNGRTWLCNAIQERDAGLLKKCLECIKSNPLAYPPKNLISLIAGYGRKITDMEMPLLVRAVKVGDLEITKVLFETLHHYSLDACREVFCLKFDAPEWIIGYSQFTIIHQAIALSNFELLEYLTNKYIEIETQQAKDPLSFCTSIDLKDLIIKKSTDKSTDHFALLDLALKMCSCNGSNSLKIYQYLLHLLEDVDIFSHMESQYSSVLHAAVKYGDGEGLINMIYAITEGVKTIKHCEDRKIIEQILNLSDAHHRTLLDYAVLLGKLDIVQYLMKLGASATCFNKKLMSPLFIAINCCDLKMVQSLLKLEISYAGKASLQSNINHPGTAGLTPLNLAVSCSTGNLPCTALKAFQSVLGYECFSIHEIDGIMPYISQPLLNISQALLSVGANPCIPDRFGETALDKAAAAGNADLVRLLLEAGADVRIPSTFYDAALHKAAAAGKPDSVGLLLQAGANPLAEDSQRNTPLDVALKAIPLKLSMELDETVKPARMITLARILDKAIIQTQSLAQAVDVKPYESDFINLYREINLIYRYADHKHERFPFTQELNNQLLKVYGISTQMLSQSKGKKRPCDDFGVRYTSLKKKRKRKNVYECDLSSGGQTIGTRLDIR